MSKKFRQILEGKHRNHHMHEMSASTAYVVIHDICTDKLLTPEQKTDVIDRFCQDLLTVQEIAEVFRNESLEIFLISS